MSCAGVGTWQKFHIMLYLFHDSLQTKSAIRLQKIRDFVYQCVLRLSVWAVHIDWPGYLFLKNAMKMLFSMSAVNISCYEKLSMVSKFGILEICYAMAEFAFLHFSIEALLLNFCKKMDCYQKLFHCYKSILWTETL